MKTTPKSGTDPVKLAYLFREGDRAIEIVAATFAEASTALSARVAWEYPAEKADYAQAFTYCGTLPF